MSKVKYSPEVVSVAADICAIAASNQEFNAAYGRVADKLGLDRANSPELTLALAAWREGAAVHGSWAVRDAEAEALLRSGWQP